MISEDDKNKVRDATDLVALVSETVELRPRGNTDLWGCCPFHGEKTPSFHVIPATQVWHCFGCGEGGDAFTYVMKREGLSFPESIRYLADRAGIELEEDHSFKRSGTKRNRLVEVCEETCSFYHTLLMRGKDARGRDYCKERELDAETGRKYRLGFAPGHGMLVRHLGSKVFTPQEMIDANVAFRSRGGGLVDRFFDRVMFPIFDEQGRCIAFGGRALDKEKTNAKYLNSSETPIFHKGKNLYGFNWAKDHIVNNNEAIVVEGYISAMSCWKAGIENIVAVLGTALTENHVKTLMRFTKKIVYMFDGDAAGQKAARRAVQFIEKDDLDLRCVILPLRSARAPRYPVRASHLSDSYYMQIADRLGLDVDTIRASAGKVFREVQQREETARRREKQRERAQSFPDTQQAAGAPAPAPSGYDEVPYEEVPYDYEPVEDPDQGAPVPTEADAGPDAGNGLLTDLERRQLACEHELLTLLTTYPDSFRAYAERITEVEWVDARSETIAWSILATPEGTAPADAMAAARAVCPEAAQLVGSGLLSATSKHPTETNIEFLLDTLELYTTRRRMKTAQARLRSNRSMSSDERRELAIQATRDAARIRELEQAVEGIADPFRE